MSKFHPMERVAEPSRSAGSSYHLTLKEKAEIDRKNKESGLQHLIDERNGKNPDEEEQTHPNFKHKKLR